MSFQDSLFAADPAGTSYRVTITVPAATSNPPTITESDNLSCNVMQAIKTPKMDIR
jgi:hypothetical protein